MIVGLSHFSFTVSDTNASLEWYVQRLDFGVRRRQRQDNAYTAELLGLPGAVIEVAIFSFPGASLGTGPTLELIQYVTPAPSGTQPIPGTLGFAHLSLVVEDIHRVHKDLTAGGVSFRSPPVAIAAGVNAGGYVCYFSDPDGNGLELFQPPGPTAQGCADAKDSRPR